MSVEGQGKPELWAAGYTAAELDDAQARFGLHFPPDLVALLRDRRPLQGYDWTGPEEPIRRKLSWPLEGLLFDVENGLWRSDWGERPARAEARAGIVAALVAAAPPLIPILGHRYLPAEPFEAGNPVLSVYQSDIIYYGRDLEDYFVQEFGGGTGPVTGPVRRIRFWSDLIDGAGTGWPA
ncbi:hypothetical protein RUR49_25640 [Pseudoxanthobacter sp. M-2]|uniref:hypothetical protein n=1 Tax=Pseudoxanthobacter sp. M-2 TaxID=3078754 RepID=UPI0038FC5789